jgi:hypothetical protein
MCKGFGMAASDTMEFIMAYHRIPKCYNLFVENFE